LTIYLTLSKTLYQMPADDRLPLLQGTLDMLVLQTLIFGPMHGHGIATTIQRSSGDVLLVDHGSLYPSLQRLERDGLIDSEWGTSDNNRRARFYRLTRAGKKKLASETGKWEKLVAAVGRVLTRPQTEEV
jgi:PadR family transcriptional regulator PadR